MYDLEITDCNILIISGNHKEKPLPLVLVEIPEVPGLKVVLTVGLCRTYYWLDKSTVPNRKRLLPQFATLLLPVKFGILNKVNAQTGENNPPRRVLRPV